MQIDDIHEALPYLFTAEEAEVITGLLQAPLLRAYFSQLRYGVLIGQINDPLAAEYSMTQNAAYSAGQEIVLAGLMQEQPPIGVMDQG